MKQKLLNSFRLKATLLVAVLCALFTGTAWADDIIDNAATSSNLGNTATSSWAANFTVTGTSGAQYYIHSMGTKNTSNALQWNANGFLYMTSTCDGYKLKSVTITTTANKNIGIYAQNTAYSAAPSGDALSTLAATSSGATYNFTSEYKFLALKGTASSTSITSIEIVWESNSATATTTAINVPQNFNTDVYVNTTAGSLTATVTPNGGSALSNPAITWSSSNEDVATIDASGAVTLVDEGTTTITASYAGAEGQYQASSATYALTVTSSAPYVQPTEIEITPNYTFWGQTAQFSGSTYSSLSGSQDNVSLAWTRGTGSTYANTTAMRFYKDNTLTFTAPTGYEIKSIDLTVSGTYDDLSFSPSGWDSENTIWTGSSETVTMSRPSNASSYATISEFTITIGLPSTDPSISADDVNIAYDATSGSIDYTLENATGNVTATVTDGNWLTLGSITSSAVPFTCSANPNNTSRTATVTLSFSGADDKVITITQAAAPVIYTTIPALFAAATSTSTDVNVTFGGWVVSAVHNNNAYLTDNQGHGLIIYASGHGFQVNDVLTGTVSCKLQTYNGSAELTNLTSSTTGLSVANNGTVTEQNIAISDLSGVNTGALLAYEGLTYNGTALVDGSSNTITPYNTLYAGTFENDKTYNVTGIYLQYNSTKEVLPRSADDIEEVVVTTPTITVSSASLTDFTYEVDNGPSTTKTISVSGANLTADITLSLGNNSDFEMSTTEGSGYTNSLTLTQSAGAVAITTVYVRLKEGKTTGDYNGTITLTSTGATNKTVSLSGSVTAPVVDYATLPFSYSGNGSGIGDVSGLTPTSLANYTSAPLIKFDATNDALVLKLNEAPGVLSFDIKGMGNGTWSGTFDVLTSDDGVDYSTTLQQYTSISTSAASREVFTLSSSVRYIKWVFTSKTSGFNVALGDIVVEKPNVTLNASGYATYTSNSAIDYSQASGYTAWAITSISGTAITFSKVTGAVPAGTGVLLMGEDGLVVAPVATTSGTALETNLLTGVTIATEVAAEAAYGLYGNTFVKNNFAGTISAGKAYLPAATVNAAGVKSFTFVFQDEATGITETRTATREEVEAIFNLAGQRMNKMQKGINIVNGKKVLVK